MSDNANDNAEKFLREVAKLSKKYDCSPVLIAYHPRGTNRVTFNFGFTGRPTAEWVGAAIEGLIINAEKWVINGTVPHHPGRLPDLPRDPGIVDLSKLNKGGN